jgi:hypothetical protein
MALRIDADETMCFTPPRVSRDSKGSKFMFSNNDIQSYEVAVERKSLSVTNIEQHFRSMSRTSWQLNLRESHTSSAELIKEEFWITEA